MKANTNAVQKAENRSIKLIVLMSAYNGEHYIREQIESILKQKTTAEVKLIVRDDGSKDATLSILETYAQKGKLSYYTGENLGVTGSFLHLLDHVPEADYYALADQDDVWYDFKLQRALDRLKLQDNSKPQLYAANQNHVDANLKFICKHFDSIPVTTTATVAIRNLVAGCTMVFNKRFLELLHKDKKLRELAFMRMHDVWMMWAALLYANFVYDHEPVMDYRRHGKNVSNGGIEIDGSLPTRIARKLKEMLQGNLNKQHLQSRSAKLVLDNCREHLSDEEIYQLDLLANYRNSILKKIKLLVCYSLFRNVRLPYHEAVLKVLFEFF